MKIYVLALLVLSLVLQSEAGIMKRSPGVCNSQSGNCGDSCWHSNDCDGGACWASANCGTPAPTGFCNSQSGNCGTPCALSSQCTNGGACWANVNCGTPAPTGFCNSQSGNCGTPCALSSQCTNGGACWANVNCPATESPATESPATEAPTTEPEASTTEPEASTTESTTTLSPFINYCDSWSTNCGATCELDLDCDGGSCWSFQEECFPSETTTTTPAPDTTTEPPTTTPAPDTTTETTTSAPDTTSSESSYAGVCNGLSNNCGTPCNIMSDCPGGDCWLVGDECPSITTTSPGGSTTISSPSLTTDSPSVITGHVIATYLGALPDGIYAPSLSSLPSEINFVLLGFAKDTSYNGNFVPFSEWTVQGVTRANIAADKANNPHRKYMISLGGAAAWGGTFGIQAGMSVSTWVNNADASIAGLVESLDADGVDIQFEGGTTLTSFQQAVPQLASKLKQRGYIVSYGPYFGYFPYGTWDHYVNLPLDNVDYVFCQFYANNRQTTSSLKADILSAKDDLGSFDKLIVGLNSLNRHPNPSVSLQVVSDLKDQLTGTFTWAAEHSKSNNPPYCIEKNSKEILVDGESATTCNW